MMLNLKRTLLMKRTRHLDQMKMYLQVVTA